MCIFGMSLRTLQWGALLILLVTRYGMGKHAILLSRSHIVPFAKVSSVDVCNLILLLISRKGILAAEVLYNPSIFTTKLSVILLYHRMFPSSRFKILLWCVGAFVGMYSFTAAMVNIFQCVPVDADWNPTIKPRCVNLGADLIALSSIDVITDFVILALPMPYLWKLHTSRSKKIQLAGIFLLGGL